MVRKISEGLEKDLENTFYCFVTIEKEGHLNHFISTYRILKKSQNFNPRLIRTDSSRELP